MSLAIIGSLVTFHKDEHPKVAQNGWSLDCQRLHLYDGSGDGEK